MDKSIRARGQAGPRQARPKGAGERRHVSGKIYDGWVSYISSEAEFTPKNVQTQEERVKLVYAVKVRVRNPKQELKPSMPADVKIQLNGAQLTGLASPPRPASAGRASPSTKGRVAAGASASPPDHWGSIDGARAGRWIGPLWNRLP